MLGDLIRSPSYSEVTLSPLLHPLLPISFDAHVAPILYATDDLILGFCLFVWQLESHGVVLPTHCKCTGFWSSCP